ncbi:MAG: heme ABC transporter permease CcmC [Pseudomonadota bacterium]
MVDTRATHIQRIARWCGTWCTAWLSPKYFLQRAPVWSQWTQVVLLLSLGYGLVGGLFLAPADYQQGDAFRIIYVHVPCAFWSIGLYIALGMCSLLVLVFNMRVAEAIARAIAPLGALCTFLALVTGSLWGRPMWGTWWIWDARLTSELILLFIYGGYIALYQAIPERRAASRIAHLFAVLGLINIPIIHYSVYWWQSLHQGATLKWTEPSLIDSSMMYPLLSMMVALGAYSVSVVLRNAARTLAQQRKVAQEEQTPWQT